MIEVVDVLVVSVVTHARNVLTKNKVMRDFLKRLVAGLLALSIWYGIFVFITMEPNPLYWGTFSKILAVILALVVINTNLDD
jgi:hypothetical protein